jgi:hypothetical protein
MPLAQCRKGTAGQRSAGGSQLLPGPPSSWVRFFGSPQRLTARRRSRYRSSSAPLVSTAVCSLGVSWCSATASSSPWLASDSVASISSKSVLIGFANGFIEHFHKSWLGIIITHRLMSAVILLGRIFLPRRFRFFLAHVLAGWWPSHTLILWLLAAGDCSGTELTKSKSKLCYDRPSVGQSVLVSRPHLGLTTRFLLLSDSCGLLMWGAFYKEIAGLPFTIAAGALQRSHSWVRVPRDSWPYYCPRLETPPTWRARSPYLYPPGTGWPSYIPRHWVNELTTQNWLLM